MRHRLALTLLASTSAALGCSRSVEPSSEGAPVQVPFTSPDLPGDGMHHVVAITDNGFDLSLPHFNGKIAGAYTITCASPDQSTSPTELQAAKAALIAAYAVKDTSCHLVPGITFTRSSKLDDIAADLTLWNQGVIAHGVDPSLMSLPRVLEGEDTYSYHGTWVSSLIAYQNPNVRLVFIENPAEALGGTKPTCPTRDQLSLGIALVQDPDVRAAYVASPIDSLTEELAAMYRHHGVTLLNKSFGPLALVKLEADCPDVADLLATYKANDADFVGLREHAVNAAAAAVSLLNVRSSGNDGAVLSSTVDHIDCPTDARNVSYGPNSIDIMMGSWSATDTSPPTISSFSNTGPCVQFYAPGDGILSMSPGGFLLPVEGTSFSAPLAVRHLSQLPPQTTPAEMVQLMQNASRDASGLLPSSWFPPELLFETAAPNSPVAF